MIKKIKIVDAICGAGKTSAAINMINSSPEEEHFLYITPYLNEVQRIIKSCPTKKFIEPQARGSKMMDIKRLLTKGRNIVSTHALFSMFDQEIIEICKLQGYTLIMDEVAEVVKPLEIKRKDLDILLEKTKINEDNSLEWVDQEYNGDLLKDYKKLVDLKAIYYYSNTALVWSFPVECFKAFDEVYILTYMFNCQTQRYYYDMYDLDYEYLKVEGNNLNTYKFSKDKSDFNFKYGPLINILDNDKMNSVGEGKFTLSKSWYNRICADSENAELKKEAFKTLSRNLHNYFVNITQTPTGLNMWTTFKNYKTAIAGKGYAKGFVSCNSRGTNEFRDRTALAYMLNRFQEPIIVNFFRSRGITVLEDEFALSELIQWIFRSALRDKQKIDLYIPSERMREMLIKWSKEN